MAPTMGLTMTLGMIAEAIGASSLGVCVDLFAGTPAPTGIAPLSRLAQHLGTVSFFVFGPVMACRQAGPDFHQVGLMNRSPYRIAN